MIFDSSERSSEVGKYTKPILLHRGSRRRNAKCVCSNSPMGSSIQLVSSLLLTANSIPNLTHCNKTQNRFTQRLTNKTKMADLNCRMIKTVLFMGSTRYITPPWGGVSRLGDGILNWVKNNVSKQSSSLGNIEEITHELTIFDPLDIFGKGGNLGNKWGGNRDTSLVFQTRRGSGGHGFDGQGNQRGRLFPDCLMQVQSFICPGPHQHDVPLWWL